MAQERPSTPEKQLLDLIEKPKERDLNQKKIKRRSLSLFSIAALRGRVSFFQDSLRSGLSLKKIFFDIKGLNRVLRLCIVLLVIYLIGNISMSVTRMQEIPEFAYKSTRGSAEVQPEDLFERKVSYYLEGPRSRNIFSFGDTKEQVEEVKKEEVAAPVEASAAETLARELGLVGIGWSDDPDVMVENVRTKKMYFLKKGQRIDGMIKVEAIFQDKVILTYDNGKEMELR